MYPGTFGTYSSGERESSEVILKYANIRNKEKKFNLLVPDIPLLKDKIK